MMTSPFPVRFFIVYVVTLIWIQIVLPSAGDQDITEISPASDRHSTTQATNSSLCLSATVCKNSKEKPVCGTDGRTYSSKCELKKARRCEGRKVRIRSLGRCSSSARGLRAKSCNPADRAVFNKNLVRIFSEEYTRDPTVDKASRADADHDSRVIVWKFQQLDEDGDGLLRRGDVRTLKKMLKKVVKPRKCAKTFDTYCDLDQDRRLSRDEWAVCLGGDLSRIIKPPPGHTNKVCNPTDRANFNRRLIQAFMKEFEGQGLGTRPTRDQISNGATLRSDTILNTPERRVITWKFRQLDRDHDGRLRRDEIRNFKAEVKSTIKPKACAKTLDTHCDLNRDQFIMASEWSVCLGVDINNAPRGGASVPIDHGLAKKGTGDHGNSAQKSMFNMLTSGTNTKSSASKRDDTPLYDVVSDQQNKHLAPSREEESVLDSGCTKARIHFLREHEANPEAHIFVPECQENGQYRKEQCHNSTGFCWCVDQTTGKPIPTTSTRNVMPNCTNVKIREFKGCSYPMRKQFLTKLLDQLTTEMMDFAADGSDKSPMLDTNTDLTLEERAVRWKLKMLDKNNNQKLERQELKQFKSVVRMKKDLRKCSRNFLRYCDESGDGSISVSEWIECTGINEQHRNLPENSHPRGINPFTVYLKGDQ